MKRMLCIFFILLITTFAYSENKYVLHNLLPNKLEKANDQESFCKKMIDCDMQIENSGYKKIDSNTDVYLGLNKNNQFLFEFYTVLDDEDDINRFFSPYDGFWLARVKSSNIILYFNDLRYWFYSQFKDEDEAFQNQLQKIGMYFKFQIQTNYGVITFSGYVSNGYNFMLGTNVQLFNTVYVESGNYSGECALKDGTYFKEIPSYNQVTESWNTSYLAHFITGHYETISEFPCPQGLENKFELLKNNYNKKKEKIILEIFEYAENKNFDKSIKILTDHKKKYQLDKEVFFNKNEKSLLFYFILGKSSKENFEKLIKNIKLPTNYNEIKELLELPDNKIYRDIFKELEIEIKYE